MTQTVDSTAIRQIRDLVLGQQVNEKLDNVQFSPVVAVPDGVALKNLEPFLDGRTRFRGKMQTSSIEDFARYSTGYAEDGARCFINADRMSAVSVFNIGTIENPGHADNTAVLSLKRTAPFTAVLTINNEHNSQKELAEWIEDWAENLIGFSSDGNAINAKKSAAALRKITIEANKKADYEDNDFSGKRSLLESVEAKTQEIMPVAFEFKCVSYEGLTERAIKLRLSIINSDRPSLVLRIVQLESIQEEIAAEFRDLLIEKFNNGTVETFIGEFTA
jgi:uncharacterized protein YfdQ (DUF2303 family)